MGVSYDRGTPVIHVLLVPTTGLGFKLMYIEYLPGLDRMESGVDYKN